MGEEYKYGWKDKVEYKYVPKKGLTEEIVEEISYIKNEPEWMRNFRLKSYGIFMKKPMPSWGSELLNTIDFSDIYYYLKPAEKNVSSWDEVPQEIKNTFDKLGIPEAERKFLAGVTAQYESEVVYHSIREDLKKKGVIFLDMDSAVKEYPDIVKRYFSTVIPPQDNKFAALNSCVWSGGSFIYVPPDTRVDIPLQAYFRINAESMGQFERTLIIADKGSYVHYIEGCTAPVYSKDSLHSAVVELVALEGAHIRYTTIQNWSTNVFNLVTKRAVAYKDAFVEWVDGNLGSKLTMKYPSVYLMGEGARGEVISVAYASKNQHQDTGAKMVHLADNTRSSIISKSISKNGGRTSYRGLVRIEKGLKNTKTKVRCDALILDEHSRSDTYPFMDIKEESAIVEHEAVVSKISDEQLFYLTSRGISGQEAMSMIVNGFIDVFAKELPLEYAVELNRLIQLDFDLIPERVG